MADWGSFAGVRIVDASVTIPAYGMWVADVLLAADTPAIPTRGSLVLGDLSMLGTVVRQSAFAGTQRARLVGGYGGWRMPVAAQAYSTAGGVLLSHVLGDAALAVGEKVNVAVDSVVGSMFVREAAAAQRVLRWVAGSWYVDPAGVTQVGNPRPSTPIASDFQLVSFAPETGKAVVATEAIADWAPGRTFTAPTLTTPRTISLVTHVVQGAGQHRVEVLTVDPGAVATDYRDPSPTDRLMRAYRAIIRAELPQLTYLGLWEYEVQATDGRTVDAVPVNPAIPLPEIVGAPLLPSIAGENVTPAIPSSCIVAFVNADPTRPVVVGGDYVTPPTRVQIGGASGAANATRKGDGCCYIVISGSGAIVPNPAPGSGGVYPFTTAGLTAATTAAGIAGGSVVTITVGQGSTGVVVGGAAG